MGISCTQRTQLGPQPTTFLIVSDTLSLCPLILHRRKYGHVEIKIFRIRCNSPQYALDLLPCLIAHTSDMGQSDVVHQSLHIAVDARNHTFDATDYAAVVAVVGMAVYRSFLDVAFG